MYHHLTPSLEKLHLIMTYLSRQSTMMLTCITYPSCLWADCELPSVTATKHQDLSAVSYRCFVQRAHLALHSDHAFERELTCSIRRERVWTNNPLTKMNFGKTRGH